MKAKKENKLGSAAEGECTDLNGINGCDVDVDVDFDVDFDVDVDVGVDVDVDVDVGVIGVRKTTC